MSTGRKARGNRIRWERRGHATHARIGNSVVVGEVQHWPHSGAYTPWVNGGDEYEPTPEFSRRVDAKRWVECELARLECLARNAAHDAALRQLSATSRERFIAILNRPSATASLALDDRITGPLRAMADAARAAGEALAALGPRMALVVPPGCEPDLAEPHGAPGSAPEETQ